MPDRLSPTVTVPAMATAFPLAGQRTVGLTCIEHDGAVLSTSMPVKVVVAFSCRPSVQVPTADWFCPSLARVTGAVGVAFALQVNATATDWFVQVPAA